MELYQLSYFIEVARHRNFSRAAERISIAQPALSQQIKNLEAELGTALFIRGRRQTRLTPAGEALLPRAEALVAQAESAKQAVAEVAQLRGGRLVVVTIPSVSACWLPEVIRGFIGAHPGIELVLVEESSEKVASMVETGRAEVGFLQLPVNSDLFDVKGLVTEPFVLLVPAGHAMAGMRSVRLAKLAAEPFVFYKGRARDTALAACRASGFEPRIACESGELETVRALVGAGLGVAVVPQLATRSLPKTLAAVSIREPRVERQLGLVTRRGHPWSAAAKAFIDAFLKISR